MFSANMRLDTLSVLLQQMPIYHLVFLLIRMLLDSLQILSILFSIPSLCLLSELFQALLLQHQRRSISLVVCLSVPVIAFNFSIIEKPSIQSKYAGLCVFLFFKFNFNYSLRVGLIEPNPLDFSYFRQLICDFFFH